MTTSYYSVERLTEAEEEYFKEKGTPSRNYGRLDKTVLAVLATKEMELKQKKDIRKRKTQVGLVEETGDETEKEIDLKKLFDRPRPWRLTRFLKDISQRPGCRIGEVTHENYTIRVIDAGMSEALGKGDGVQDSETYESVNIDSAVRKSLMLLKPYDVGASSDVWWDDFELWRDLISTSLINVLPDRPFSMYVFAKDAVGDDVPVYYMELEIGAIVDRHVIVWELDQVLTKVEPFARPHEASKSSEYASVYQKIYFFLNWDIQEPRRLEKITVADLPRRHVTEWNRYFRVLADTRPSDAFISICVIVATTVYSIYSQDYSISLIAGILVAGIAAEEFMPPQTMLMGAIARFYANESLALHMYYAANLDISTKRVIITLLASMGEIVDFVNENNSRSITVLGVETKYGDALLVAASTLSCLGLFQTAFAGIFAQFSHSDFPKSTSYNPKVYTETNGFVTQVIGDCKPVEEFSSVFRPIIHWQRGMQHRFLGNDIDWGSPGAPPSWVCYFMSTPASALITTKMIYGDFFRFWLLPFAILEQALAIIGGLMIIILDVPVVAILAVNVILKQFVSRESLKYLNGVALMMYWPAQAYLFVVDEYNAAVAELLELNILHARKRSTARLYRFPLCQSVRTGRSSNHSWKFGDYMYDSAYYRISDMVVVNPRASKLGMMGKMRLMYKRHKLIWNTTAGVRYSQPVLSCGDNTVARKNSYFGKGLDHEERRRLEHGSVPTVYVDPITGAFQNYKSDNDLRETSL